MDSEKSAAALVARCVVCKGNIHGDQPFEVWEGGFYCERHSLPYLHARAREYASRLRAQPSDELKA